MEGFTIIQDIGFMEIDKDVNEMAKHLASHTMADNCVNLGTVTIKKLQGLIFWIKDSTIRGQELDFTAAGLCELMTRKSLKQSEGTKDEPSVKELDKFNPAYFEVHEDAFLNLLAQMRGALLEPLCYVVHPNAEPDEFENMEQHRMFQLPLEGKAYDMDNKSVYQKLKSFLNGTPGWAWIKDYDAAEDGCGVFQAWADHYNG
jgi:hypothetical protein